MSRGQPRKLYDTAADPSLGRARRVVSAWAGLFLLLFNLVAGAVLPARAAPAAADAPHLVICTAGGMAVIDRNGTPVAPDHAGENGFCGACLPFVHGAVLAPASAATPQPFVQPVPCTPLADVEPVLVERPLRLANPRAPPTV